MRVGSLFSGIGAGDLGLERAGMTVAWQAEINKHCCRVLERHWPEVPNLGDVRDIRLREPICPKRSGQATEPSAATQGAVGRDGQGRLSPVDLVVGGFPCQDVSVAGKRAGLHGERSGLWFEFQRILRALRPRWALIENVPGLLSSHQGRDFATILDGLGECGFGGIAWAILDSRHWGVAQRRRRVFVVCGPSRRGVEQVLSLCEGCGGHPAPRREAREDVAASLGGGTYGAGRRSEDDPNLVLAYGGNRTSGPIEVAAALQAHGGPHGRQDFASETFILAHTLRAEGFGASEDGMGRGTPLTVIQDVRGVRDKAQNGIGVQESETMYTLDGVSQHAAAFIERSRRDGRDFDSQTELAYALTNPGSGGRTHSRQLYDGTTVRRLTPVECERLQGLPDGWTCTCGADDDLPACRCADGPRYRALGNAMTMPVLEYLGRRIMAVEA